MTALRWILGSIAAAVAGAWVAFVVLAEGFRRSFGASPRGPAAALLPALVAGLVVLTLAAPERRPLLHFVAALLVTLVAGCALIAREAPVVAAGGALFAAAWLCFYWSAAWRA